MTDRYVLNGQGVDIISLGILITQAQLDQGSVTVH